MVLETNRMLQRCADQHQIVHAMATQLARLSGCPVVWYSADAEGLGMYLIRLSATFRNYYSAE